MARWWSGLCRALSLVPQGLWNTFRTLWLGSRESSTDDTWKMCPSCCLQTLILRTACETPTVRGKGIPGALLHGALPGPSAFLPGLKVVYIFIFIYTLNISLKPCQFSELKADLHMYSGTWVSQTNDRLSCCSALGYIICVSHWYP